VDDLTFQVSHLRRVLKIFHDILRPCVILLLYGGNRKYRSWLHVCLALLGQTLDESGSNICGVVGSLRKGGGGNRIAVWMRWTSKKEPDIVKSVGYRLLQIVHGELPSLERGALQLTYMHHADSMKSGFSYKNQSKLTGAHVALLFLGAPPITIHTSL